MPNILKPAQIAHIVNAATRQWLGETDVLQEDLSNVVDIGSKTFEALTSVEAFSNAINNAFVKTIYADREFWIQDYNILMDTYQYGALIRKIDIDIPDAEENETYELVDGATYNQDIFYQPKVTETVYSKRTTWEIPMSYGEVQLRTAFSGPDELQKFFAYLNNTTRKSFRIKMASMVKATVANLIGETVADEYPDGNYSAKSGVRAINALYLYNQAHPDAQLTVEDTKTSPEYNRFVVKLYKDIKTNLSAGSRVFNIEHKVRQTRPEDLHVIMLAPHVHSAETFMQSDTYHDFLVELPMGEVTPFWQGSGEKFDYEDCSFINVKTASGKEVELGNIHAVFFDRDAAGVSYNNERATTHYNAKAEFYNNFFKADVSYFNALDENAIVVFAA